MWVEEVWGWRTFRQTARQRDRAREQDRQGAERDERETQHAGEVDLERCQTC